MSYTARALVLAEAGMLLTIGLASAQPPIEVSPTRVSVTATTDTAYLGLLGVGPVGIATAGNLPFKLAGFRPSNSGDPDIDFLIVSPSSGIAPAVVDIALNPNVVPYMPSGVYERDVLFAPADQPSSFAAVGLIGVGGDSRFFRTAVIVSQSPAGRTYQVVIPFDRSVNVSVASALFQLSDATGRALPQVGNLIPVRVASGQVPQTVVLNVRGVAAPGGR